VTVIGIEDAAMAGAKALTYAATLGAAGAVFFLRYSHDLVAESHAREIRRLIRVLLAASALASAAKILATSASMSGGMSGLTDSGLLRMILRGGEGWATLVRLVGLVLMLPTAGPPPPRALLGSVVAATSFAWVGHVHSLAAAGPATSVLALHLLGVAFWAGGLMPLLMVSRGRDVPRVAAIASRFGAVALVVVAALIAAGACLLCLVLQSVAEFWTSGYGRLVLAKLGLVLCLVSLAAFNRFKLTPRLREGDARAVTALHTSIRFEIALAGAIFIVTSAMTTVTGPAALD
jgi:putative copper export protein